MEACGASTATDDPCELPGSRDDGRCHLHTEIDDQRSRGGRPSTLADHWDEIMAAAELGMSKRGIANLAMVARSTLYRWLDEYEEFRREFLKARARGEGRLITRGLDPDDGAVDPRAAMFVLERSYGYTKKSSVEHSTAGPSGGGIAADCEVNYS